MVTKGPESWPGGTRFITLDENGRRIGTFIFERIEKHEIVAHPEDSEFAKARIPLCCRVKKIPHRVRPLAHH